MATTLVPLQVNAVKTTTSAPSLGYVNRYDASAGNLTVTLPALSGLNVGARAMLQKHTLDVSANTVTFNRAGSDQFDDASTSFALTRSGESRTVQVVSISGVKRWKITEAMVESVPGGSGGSGSSPFIALQDYAVGDGVADDTTAVQAAVTAAKAAGVPIYDFGGTYKLTGTIDARCTVSGASQSDDFKGIIGAGREATKFIQYTNNIPIFRFSGRYFSVKGFTAKFNTVQTTAQTAGNVFDFEDWIFFCTFDDLLIQNGYIGFNSKDGAKTDINGALLFSNTFSNIRFKDNRYIHWRFNASPEGGTGNHMSNIYMGSDGVDRMYRGVERFNGFSDVWDQLNIEQTTFEDCAFYDTAGNSLTINSFHVEGCRFPCGSGQRSIVSTNGEGTVRLDIGIDECFFGPHKVSGITRSGTTATATIDLLGKDLGGHGLRVGDTIVVDGANEAAYNITATVTAVPTTTTVQYTVAGSPTTPATLATGADHITLALGAALGLSSIQVVRTRADSEIVELDARLRDVRVTSKDSDTRLTTFRLVGAEDDSKGRVKLRNLSLAGQMAHAHLPQAIDVVAIVRASNVATVYTRVPHRLRVGDTVLVDTTASGFAIPSGVVDVTGPHSFTYGSTGTDAPLARLTDGSQLLLKTFGSTNKARASNVATLTLNATHGLAVGQRVRIAWIAGGYTNVDAVISAVTSTTISYRNVGANESTSADTDAVVMVLDAGVSLQYLTEPGAAKILEEADWLYSGCDALAFGTVNAGTGTNQTGTHYGVRAGDRIEWTPIAAIPDGLQVQAAATADNTITWRAYNPTGSNIVSGTNLVRYRIVRA